MNLTPLSVTLRRNQLSARCKFGSLLGYNRIMRQHVCRLVCSLAFICVFVCGTDARGSEASDNLRNKLAKVATIKPDSVELGNIIDSLVGGQSLATKCLEDLPGLNNIEREEFKHLLVDLARASLRRQLLSLRGADVKWGVEMRDGTNRIAKSVVKLSGETIDVDWVIVKEDGDWRIGDVVTEGASMVKTWRHSFRSAYDKGGWLALAKKLRSATVRVAGDKM